MNAVIVQSKIVRCCINNCRNWGKISIRCCIHKRHPHLALAGELRGVFCEYLQENWPHHNCTTLYWEMWSLRNMEVHSTWFSCKAGNVWIDWCGIIGPVGFTMCGIMFQEHLCDERHPTQSRLMCSSGREFSHCDMTTKNKDYLRVDDITTTKKNTALQWRNNECDGVSNHQPHDCLLNRSFMRRSKKTSKLHVTGICEGNSPVTGEFPTQGPVTRKMFPFDDVIMTQPFMYHVFIYLMTYPSCTVWFNVNKTNICDTYGIGPLCNGDSNTKKHNWFMVTSSNETFFVLLALCAGNSLVTRQFPLTKANDAELWCFFDLRLGKQLSKQSKHWWFEMPLHSLWCHCNVLRHLLQTWKFNPSMNK